MFINPRSVSRGVIACVSETVSIILPKPVLPLPDALERCTPSFVGIAGNSRQPQIAYSPSRNIGIEPSAENAYNLKRKTPLTCPLNVFHLSRSREGRLFHY